MAFIQFSRQHGLSPPHPQSSYPNSIHVCIFCATASYIYMIYLYILRHRIASHAHSKAASLVCTRQTTDLCSERASSFLASSSASFLSNSLARASNTASLFLASSSLLAANSCRRSIPSCTPECQHPAKKSSEARFAFLVFRAECFAQSSCLNRSFYRYACTKSYLSC
jgi:hypothetical protein